MRRLLCAAALQAFTGAAPDAPPAAVPAPIAPAAVPAPSAPVAATAPIVPVAAGEPWSAGEIAQLRTDLDALLAGSPALRGAHAGVYAIETATGTVLYGRNAEDDFQPASTLKLLAGSLALERLGPSFAFHTQLAMQDGDVTLVGGGDPFLSSADLSAAAAAVAASGAVPIRGLTVDDGRYERAPYPAGWTWDDFAYDYAVPVSALTVDENVVHIGFGSAGPLVVAVQNAPLIADSLLACKSDPARLLTPGDVRAGAPNAEDSLDTRTVAPDCAALSGTLPAGKTTTLDVAVRDPAIAAWHRLAAALRGVPAGFPAEGLPITELRGGIVPEGAKVVWNRDSDPLAAWLGPRFWIPSDNLVAELLVRELAYASGSRPGSTAAGLALERAWLQSIGVDPATVTLADGCGMSQYDRITPRALVTILQHDWNGPNRQLVLDSLPVGGARGTIEGIAGTPAAGRVFAKTGSMSHVRGLAGYLATRRHGAVTFAISVDDWLGDYPALAALRAAVLSRIISD